jgi:hypothetical protein
MRRAGLGALRGADLVSRPPCPHYPSRLGSCGANSAPVAVPGNSPADSSMVGAKRSLENSAALLCAHRGAHRRRASSQAIGWWRRPRMSQSSPLDARPTAAQSGAHDHPRNHHHRTPLRGADNRRHPGLSLHHQRHLRPARQSGLCQPCPCPAHSVV